ncbi:MAG: hypothetical protein KAS32_16145 [Candidatus Peribacteraceae bacterium]|nr:hypothetical protein [Candidatus Peribacteraceae bacterium]
MEKKKTKLFAGNITEDDIKKAEEAAKKEAENTTILPNVPEELEEGNIIME